MEKSHLKDRKDKFLNKSLIIGSVLATFIALTPYFFYLYESIPDEQIWETKYFSFDAKSWESVNYIAWVFTGKFVPLILIFIWFFSCKHWWYHVLLVPIAMYIYQLIALFNDNITYFDNFEVIYMLPVMSIVVPSIYLIRAQMFNKLNDAGKTMEELEEEFKLKPKTLFGKLSDYF